MSRHQLCGHRRPEFPTPFEVTLLRLTGNRDVFGRFRPAETCGDRVDGTLGTFGPLVAVQVQPERAASRGVEYLVVADVEGVFERAGDVAEIGRAAEYVACLLYTSELPTICSV